MTAAALTSDLAGAVCVGVGVLTMLEVNREMGHEHG